MEEIKETTQNEAEKATATWSVRLYENDKLRINDLLEALPGADKREKLMNIISKAEIENNKNQAGSEFLMQLQQYTNAIMQAATAQAVHAGNVEALIRTEYEATITRLQQEKAALQSEKTAQEEKHKEQLDESKAAIKEKDAIIDKAVKRDAEHKDTILGLEAKLEVAQRNAEAVSSIHKDYANRLKAAEEALKEAEAQKREAETEKATIYARLANVQKIADDAATKAAANQATIDAQSAQIAALKEQLTDAAKRAERAEAEKMHLMDSILQQQSQKATKKASIHKDANFDEHEVEVRGQQQLPLPSDTQSK